MQISQILKIGRGVTALIGGGGKTTLMETLARELCRRGSVIICTSTKIRRPTDFAVLLDPAAEEARRALAEHGVLCVGSELADEKLAAPTLSFETLEELADFVIVEADGARCLPLKAHASYEPVIPANAQRTVLVVGVSGFGKRIAETCHRPALYAALAGVTADESVTPEIAARVIRAEGWGDRVYVNQVETEEDYRAAAALARELDVPVAAGSLHKGVYACLS